MLRQQAAGIDLGNQIGQHYVERTRQRRTQSCRTHTRRRCARPLESRSTYYAGPKRLGFRLGLRHSLGNAQRRSLQNSGKSAGVRHPEIRRCVQPGEGLRCAQQRRALQDQTEIGIFWAYDRPNLPGKPGVGPPPVLFVENMIDIAEQAGNTPAENARMFAMASVAQADAAIAAWDTKYEEDFGGRSRRFAPTRRMDDDDPNTVEDPNWAYLGAPGCDPNATADDFTPPFPAYTSGHATMGGAIFKALELFYGTNDFNVADAAHGADPVTTQYVLDSNEARQRRLTRFRPIHPDGSVDGRHGKLAEGENGMSRVYLGVHWLFDQQDGIALGNAIAQYAAGHYFQAVPEP